MDKERAANASSKPNRLLCMRSTRRIQVATPAMMGKARPISSSNVVSDKVGWEKELMDLSLIAPLWETWIKER